MAQHSALVCPRVQPRGGMVPGAVPPAIARTGPSWQNRAMDQTDLLDYRNMMEQALRGVIRDSLRKVAQEGLPGEHHFFISFLTGMEGVDLPATLRRQHPEEMTIVIQFQFLDLEVRDDDFSVTLNFNSVPSRLTVPLAAITSFVDPAAAFGLSFSAEGVESEGGDAPPLPGAKPRAPRGEVVPFKPLPPTEAGG